jgi:hypothetical protein
MASGIGRGRRMVRHSGRGGVGLPTPAVAVVGGDAGPVNTTERCEEAEAGQKRG